MNERFVRLMCASSCLLPLVLGCGPSAPHRTWVPVTLPLNQICGRPVRDDPDTLTVLAHAVKRIATSGITNEGQGHELRELLPDHNTFLGLYGDLCWLATTDQLPDTQYHHLLEDVLPLMSFDSQPATSDSRLPAPGLVAPADDVIFDHYPRRTALEWRSVGGATHYLVEVEVLVLRGAWQPSISLPPDVTSTTVFDFDFDGANWGRWRIRALDGRGRPGVPSGWRRFRYLR